MKLPLPLIALAASASAQSFSVTRIVDSQTVFPGGYQMPSLTDPRLDGERVIIYAESFQMRGVYAWEDGELVPVVTQSDVRPGTAIPLTYPGPRSSSGVGRTLVAASSGGDVVGYYERIEGAVATVVDNSVAFPGIVQNVSSFVESTRLYGQRHFCVANGPEDQAVFMIEDGVPSLICDTSFVVPNGSPHQFHSFSRLRSSGDHVVFQGVFRPVPTVYLTGAYLWHEGVFTTVIDPGETPSAANPAQPLAESMDVSLHENVVRFAARYSNSVPSPGELTEYVDGQYRCLIAPQRRLPQTPCLNWIIHTIASDGPNMFFLASAVCEQGNTNALYLYRGGTISRLVLHGDPLDGDIVTGIYPFNDDAAEAGRLVVSVNQQAANAVYVVDVRGFVPCADITGDGGVGLDDLASLLANFGLTSAATLLGDISGDERVGLDDLAMLLSQFGADCP